MFWVLKEPSLIRDGAFEYPQHMLWSRNKKSINNKLNVVIIFISINFSICFRCLILPSHVDGSLSTYNVFWLSN